MSEIPPDPWEPALPKCSTCGSSFVNEPALLTHMAEEHGFTSMSGPAHP